MPVWSRLQRSAKGEPNAEQPGDARKDSEQPVAEKSREAENGAQKKPSKRATKSSRSAAAEEKKSAEEARRAATAEEAEQLRAWLEGFGDFAGHDSLLDFDPEQSGNIDLTQAHPSGLAQLLAGRKTRLSTIIRESAHSVRAMKAARLLRAKSMELSSERGIDAAHLSAGLVSWGTSDQGEHRQVCAPVMLIPLMLSARTGQDDYELQLNGQARVNPALVRLLRENYGIIVDPQAIARLAYSTARFDPAPVLEHLRVLTTTIPAVTVEHHLIAGTFADLSRNLHDPVLAAGEGMVHQIRAAAQAHESGEAASPPEALSSRYYPSLDSRSPQDEFLVLDADPDQQLVLDAIQDGESLVVAAPSGSGQTQTVLNAISALVYQGKSVLVVSERRATLHELTSRLAGLSLESMLLQLSAQAGPQQVRSQIIRGISRNEKAQEPQLDSLHRTLIEHRHQLVDHVASLHNVRERWGCSPYQAMQSLAELTSINPAPATTVRLKRSVLDAIRDRSELSAKLRRAAELGSFSDSATRSPWYGARLLTRKETEEKLSLAQDLAEQLPVLAQKMQDVAEYSHIKQGRTFSEWGEQLDLLVAVRGSLDKFMPDIFDRPVNDLITATAPSGWRRERNIEMPAMQRSRLRRVAREYVRPGVHIEDLHDSLRLIQEQRESWAEYATSQRHPAVPSGLAELRQRYQALAVKLEQLSAALEQTSDGGDLDQSDFGQLIRRLELLAADQQTLEHLPERTLLEESMRERGLGELLEDLAVRQVSPAQTRAELELAWWQSALEAMISGDEYLAMSDGESLRKLEAEFRLADQAHVLSGASRLRWKLAKKWRSAVSGRSRSAEFLRSTIKDGRVTLEALEANAAELLKLLVPVWTMSPLIAPAVLPDSKRFDAVILLDAESMSLPSALPVIARANQILAFGNETLPGPRTLSVSTESLRSAENETTVRPRGETPAPAPSIMSVLGRILPTQRLGYLYRSIDEELSRQLSEICSDAGLAFIPEGQAVTGIDRRLHVEYLPDGTGLPGSDGEGVESVVAEVDRVVSEVLESARSHPRSSLAVVTASPKHAARVAAAVRISLANHPDLREFFQGETEPFRVVSLDRTAGLVRDRVIFSLGYGRTPHGRALHNFGSLSQPGGRGKFVLAMTRAREHLTVLSCFKPDDLDTGKLSYGARDFYDLLERELSSGIRGKTPVSAGGGIEEDPLVADLADRLRARDTRVWYNYEGMLDIVVAPDPLRYLDAAQEDAPAPVAVESDGSQRYRGKSVRERSRLRPQQLEAHGWRHMSLWTIEVFTDPSACADRIGGYLGVDTLSAGTLPSLYSTVENVEQSGQGPETTGVPGDAEPVIPRRAGEDEPRGWGDQEGREDSHDAWLREQRPPHWE
ncbi:DUF4011 domain-containing protein [Acaricomes phytoseiuli]|uniref:DUF4011 domain-containing protein n=1 Tax=Acaricomes phytoseiuli TaxID=291968 RepID=UPI0022225DFA|nr:DUF4011 domain-containing protein [Acaricomes phytoseiuli]MCW1250096.1 DUF4011 domain-containing protein [Acaricomes phytoseiuli]